MRKRFFIPAVIFIFFSLSGCKKEDVQIPFEDVFSKPYTGGQIKLQYPVPATVNGIPTTKDTLVTFTSIGNNPSEKDDYGYSKPAIPWFQLHRINPGDFQNRVFIFSSVNLNTLTLPYTFKKGNSPDAQINYTIGLRPYYDINGNLVYGTNTYAATTYSPNFELTILSNNNNRLQGVFSGDIVNQDGDVVHVNKGLFDIQIVEK